jgi:putative membrane protein
LSADTETSDKTELAEDRTAWAEDRTILASERTFAGWIRTGLASVAVALGLHALFGAFEPTWIPKLLASLCILTAVMIFVSAWRGTVRTQKRMHGHETSRPGNGALLAITAVLCAVSLGTGVVLWLL